MRMFHKAKLRVVFRNPSTSRSCNNAPFTRKECMGCTSQLFTHRIASFPLVTANNDHKIQCQGVNTPMIRMLHDLVTHTGVGSDAGVWVQQRQREHAPNRYL